LGRKMSVVVSSGSTGIANAAASARAGIRAVVIVARGVPQERIYPAYALGALIIEVDAEVDTIVERIGELGSRQEIYVSSTARSSNPYQAEGPKTIAYEIVDQLGAAPDWVVVPVGGGGTVAGVWRGFEELRALGRIDNCPRILGVVARDYDAIARALHDDLADPMAVFGPEYVAPPTILVKIAHVYPPDGVEGLAALRNSGGVARVISETEALAAQRRVAAEEGLYVEPSSAAAVAAYDQAHASGAIGEDETVVVIMSGSGFRETFVSAERQPVIREGVSLQGMLDLLLDLQRKAA
jgi:threonine synthase